MDRKFRDAQWAYDNMQPPEYWEDEPEEMQESDNDDTDDDSYLFDGGN
jgi:hypothetical protein